MLPNVRGVANTLSIALVGVLVAGCTAGSPTAPPPSTTPGPSPTPSAVPTPSPTAAPFAFDIVPPEEPPEVRAAIPGEWICFLAVLSADDLRAGPIEIAATATGAKVQQIVQPTVAAPIGEVWVVPDPATTETDATATFTATRGSITKTVERSIHIMPMPDERAADARPHMEWWVSWLAAKHPELGITTATTWTPRFVSILLVVSHYAYYSDEWELTVLWHNMIAPYDWTEIHLRHRGTEAVPGLAFRQDSMTNGTEPHKVEPPVVPVR